MTADHQASRGRIASAAMLATGTLVAGALGAVAPAGADTYYLALAWQETANATTANPGPSGVGESRVFDQARINAINDCASNGGDIGGGQCAVRVVATNECAAVAGFYRGSAQGWKWATATSFNRQLAEELAIANAGGGIALVSACPTYRG